jgi:hypothetical protein
MGNSNYCRGPLTFAADGKDSFISVNVHEQHVIHAGKGGDYVGELSHVQRLVNDSPKLHSGQRLSICLRFEIILTSTKNSCGNEPIGRLSY